MSRNWRVDRVSGALVPGFTKAFRDHGTTGTTYFLGMPIGSFDVVQVAGGTSELRYRRWPIVDVLERAPFSSDSIVSSGFIRLGHGRRVRFCEFRLERQSVD